MKTHRWLLVCLSILLMTAGYLFDVPEYNEIFTIPQHGYFDLLEDVRNLIKGNTISQISYFSFFTIDFLWAPTLLTLAYRYLVRPGAWWPLKPISGNVLSSAFFLFACLAYVFDVLENTSYLLFKEELIHGLSLKTIVDIKNAMYALVFLVMIVAYYQKYIFPKINLIKAAIKSSFLSIFTILLLIGLATFMDQGSTVIVHLLDHPVSLLLTMILLNLLAMVSAHYPDYLDKYFHPRSAIEWQLDPLFGKKPFKGIGLITYRETSESKDIADYTLVRQIGNKKSDFFNHFRKIMGALVMITWIYVLLFVYRKYESPTLALPLILLCITFLSIWLHFWSTKVKNEWKVFVENNQDKAQNIQAVIQKVEEEDAPDIQVPDRVVACAKATLFFFLALLFFTGLTLWLACIASWVITWYMLVFNTIINVIFIILFQQFRTIINLPLFSDKLKWIPIVYLGKDLTHVRFFALMGIATLATFVGATFDPISLNALVIMLMFVFLLYGMIVILLKHHLYYSNEHQKTNDTYKYPVTKRFFREYVPILGVLIVLWIMFSGMVGNGLHKIPFVEEKPTEVLMLDTYKDELKLATHEDWYLVASYGGGLRATAWTMLLLDTIQKAEPDFFNQSLAMSGVSGGFLGLSFYTALLLSPENERLPAIETIGKQNLLSIDISYLLGFDLFRELIPYIKKFCFRDRAGRSMEAYAGLIQSNDQALTKDLLNSSYRNYWTRVYKYEQAKKRHFPALIGNTTGTNSQYGIACSLAYDEDNDPFPGAVDILTFDAKAESISYLDATSTTERFPVFSPAAEIENKGNFLDGGYFENSGLLSLMNFYEFLEKDDAIHFNDEHTKVIIIINSKEAYISKVLGENIHPKSNKATSEFGAILQTVADVATLSLALEQKYEKRFGENYIPIYLPYHITYDDVVSHIGGIPENPGDVQKILYQSNKKIRNAIEKAGQKKDKPIPPALARVLSDPAFDYIKAMLKHEEVEQAIEQIKG